MYVYDWEKKPQLGHVQHLDIFIYWDLNRQIFAYYINKGGGIPPYCQSSLNNGSHSRTANMCMKHLQRKQLFNSYPC